MNGIYLTQLLVQLSIRPDSWMNTCRCGNRSVTPPPPNDKSTQTIEMKSFVASFINSIGWLGSSFAQLVGWLDQLSARQLDERFNDATVGSTGWMNLTFESCLDQPVGQPSTQSNCWTDRLGWLVGLTVGSCKFSIKFLWSPWKLTSTSGSNLLFHVTFQLCMVLYMIQILAFSFSRSAVTNKPK